MLRSNKISEYKIKKIMEYFCADIEASKTCIISRINRNTINRYYNIFRTLIFLHRERFRQEYCNCTGFKNYNQSDKKLKIKYGYRSEKKGAPYFIFCHHRDVVFSRCIEECDVELFESIMQENNKLITGSSHNIDEIESFWSFMKRRLNKFYGVNNNLLFHIKETEWRWKKDYDQLYNELIFLYKAHQKGKFN